MIALGDDDDDDDVEKDVARANVLHLDSVNVSVLHSGALCSCPIRSG